MSKHLLILPVLAIALSFIIIPSELANSEDAIIIFDKPMYNPFDTVKILIADPSSNIDKERNDVIQAIVYTKSNVGNLFEFTEVAPDAGVFQSLVTLTPDQNVWPADLVVRKDDNLFVQFSSERDSSTSKVSIDFVTSLVMFDKIQYSLDEKVRILLLDINENRDPNVRDITDLTVWSTTDVKGLTVQVKEISNDSGVFSGLLNLSDDQSSSGSTLRVTSSDVITAKYTGRNLPPISQEGESDPELNDLFGAALVAPKKPEITREPPSHSEIVDQFGSPVDNVTIGQQVIIQDNVVNKQNTNLKFAYIVLIKDQEGVTSSLSWITGEATPLSTFKAGQSWAPTEIGDYDITIFLWQSIDNPVVLAPQKTMTVNVTHPLD